MPAQGPPPSGSRPGGCGIGCLQGPGSGAVQGAQRERGVWVGRDGVRAGPREVRRAECRPVGSSGPLMQSQLGTLPPNVHRAWVWGPRGSKGQSGCEGLGAASEDASVGTLTWGCQDLRGKEWKMHVCVFIKCSRRLVTQARLRGTSSASLSHVPW